ncbi:lysozyme [Prevotella bivia DNF00320]|uniref:Lysozyme n=1 Tax=Prevotella bivia DNF00320 TaxID=1401068 RepID=A0A096A219_9BACT|nr:lysozyme [Prevotella bivia]KGF41050.1 lysozyme [Prevotella bivia DNF00320]
MNFAKTILSFCLLLMCFQPLSAQSKRRRLADLPPFERAVVCIKYFEGMHGRKDYPYVGYGHQLLPGEHFSSNMSEWQADSLLRLDLMKRLMVFKDYGKDALLLAVLSYNVGVGQILGYGKYPKSQLLRKIEAGNRNFYKEYVAFCRYKGKVLRGLVKRRQIEYYLFKVK